MRFGKGIRVLLVGPLPPAKPSRSNPVGGAAVNFAEMVRSLRDRDFEVSLVDTSRPRINLTRWMAFRNNIITVFRVFCQTALQVKHAQSCFLNISAGATWTLGAFMWLLCALAGRPMALRVFGGDLAIRYERCRAILRWWADRTYMRSDVVYVQTRRQLLYFRTRDNFRWHANTRDVAGGSKQDPNYDLRGCSSCPRSGGRKASERLLRLAGRCRVPVCLASTGR